MGDWQGTFWGAHRVAIDNGGQFTIKDAPGGKVVRGDIWLNLKDATLNFKIPPRYHGDKTNDYYGTYEPPSTIKIVKQENGNEKALTKIRTLPLDEEEDATRKLKNKIKNEKRRSKEIENKHTDDVHYRHDEVERELKHKNGDIDYERIIRLEREPAEKLRKPEL